MGLLGIKKKPLLPHCCFKFLPFHLLHKEGTRATVIDQGTKSKRRGAKSAEDFAEKNLDDLYRAVIAPTNTPRFPPRALYLRVSMKKYEKTTDETDGLI
jgi:hypothetical protein